VITTVDKASNNFAFTCKKLYASIMYNEIINSSTYNQTFLMENSILTHSRKLISKYKLNSPIENLKFPFIFAIPKFHKNPVKFRYITSSVNSAFKDLSILINKFLDQLVSFIISSTNITFHSYLIIDNSLSLINSIKHKNIKSVKTYDFTSLYTKIPLNLLLEKILLLIDEYWPEEELFNTGYLSFSISEVKVLLDEGLKHNYIKINNTVYKQVIGIPMGSNYSVNLANLFLFYYEHNFIYNCIHKEQYSLTFRYIDDLIAFNNHNIQYDLSNIYPSSMEIEPSNSAPYTQANYLDININCKAILKIKLYDKKRDFNFEILGFPHITSNIPQYITFNTYSAQVLRFANICSDNITDFNFNLRRLNTIFIKNGFGLFTLFKLYKKIFFKFIYHRDLLQNGFLEFK
jgi:hypothetical protein